MTPDEWDRCDRVDDLLGFAEAGAGQRQRVLFVCACCRLVWEELHYADLRAAVEVAERHADRPVPSELAEAVRRMEAVGSGLLTPNLYYAMRCVMSDGWTIRAAIRLQEEAWSASNLLGAEANRILADYARDVFCHPARSSPLRREWRSADAFALAGAALAERSLPDGQLDPASIAVLADALEDAGCDDSSILSHLRRAAPHVRGCWAVERVLRGN